jgi:hypothetical protein
MNKCPICKSDAEELETRTPQAPSVARPTASSSFQTPSPKSRSGVHYARCGNARCKTCDPKSSVTISVTLRDWGNRLPSQYGWRLSNVEAPDAFFAERVRGRALPMPRFPARPQTNDDRLGRARSRVRSRSRRRARESGFPGSDSFETSCSLITGLLISQDS